MMTDAVVTTRELANHSAEVLRRVQAGTHLRVTRNGDVVAELRPPPRTAPTAEVILQAFAHLPTVDATQLRDDLDMVLDDQL